MKILIKGGRVVDPANNVDEVTDIFVDGVKISRVAKNISCGADTVIDATGKIIMPGLVDMHVHLREPGREDKETVATGTRAAAKGGITSVLAMPNTLPAIDCPEHVKSVREIINNSAEVHVFVAGAITRGRLGAELTEISALKQEGVVAITDDGVSVDSDELMREACVQAAKEDIAVICHCEDKILSNDGVVNLGFISTRAGLRGISKASEFTRIERDIRLAEETKTAVHIAHVSCKESVEIIAQAKKRGVKVTAEIAPHHFSLSEEAVLGYDTNMKMNPPLRGKEDITMLKAALQNGVIDAIASDHAPHTPNEKDIEFERAEFGVIGLETALAVSITELISTGVLDWPGLVRKMALTPAQILNIDKGTLGVGKDADIVIVAPDKEWVVQREAFVSKSKNSAFLGRTLKGFVECTMCGGKIVYKA